MLMRPETLLSEVGRRLHTARSAQGLPLGELARRAGLSRRYLAMAENGQANLSLLKLAALAGALKMPMRELCDLDIGRAPELRLALLGLRGAGKTSVGRALAHQLEVPFFELDQLIEQAAGMPIGPIFELHGERWFRRLERETLARFLLEHKAAVLATGGGLVAEPETFDLLLRNARTVWLKARPREHWDRVVAQGDRRPMANRAQAKQELEALLAAREPLYARAEITADTSGTDAALTVERLAGRLTARLAAPQGPSRPEQDAPAER